MKDVNDFVFNLLTKKTANQIFKLHKNIDSISRENQQLLRIFIGQVKTTDNENIDSNQVGRKFFDEYIHWPVLCEFINSFTNSDQLPDNWSQEVSDKKGVYYLDHVSKKTSFLNPNLINFDMSSQRRQPQDFRRRHARCR